MSAAPPPAPFEVPRRLSERDADAAPLTLRGDALGEGPPLVLLHGLTATRRNVVQGSAFLARQGYRLIAYDARGHGRSDPPPSATAYDYEDLVGDLEAVLAALALERPVLVGSSMGAATAMAFTLRQPDRAAALVQITPAYAGARTPRQLEYWDGLAGALEQGGVDEFVDAAVSPALPERWREPVRVAVRQRVERHERLDAVAAALRVVPRSAAFGELTELEALELPVLVVGSRDEADPMHPLATAREYAERLPRAELVVEAEGETPLAWRGAALSREIGAFLARKGPYYS